MYSPAVAALVSMSDKLQRDAMGGEIITKTLNAVNATTLPRASVGISNNADYAFQTSVLSAAYSGRGAFIDMRI